MDPGVTSHLWPGMERSAGGVRSHILTREGLILQGAHRSGSGIFVCNEPRTREGRSCKITLSAQYRMVIGALTSLPTSLPSHPEALSGTGWWL